MNTTKETSARQKKELRSNIKSDIAKLKTVLLNIEHGRFTPGDLRMLQLAAAGCAIAAEDFAHLAK
jgi:hypothetical protein